MAFDPELRHTITVAGTVATSVSGLAATIWKLVTNHVWHMKQDIIKNADENRVKVVTEIEKSNKDNVIAIKQAAVDIVSAIARGK